MGNKLLLFTLKHNGYTIWSPAEMYAFTKPYFSTANGQMTHEISVNLPFLNCLCTPIAVLETSDGPETIYEWESYTERPNPPIDCEVFAHEMAELNCIRTAYPIPEAYHDPSRWDYGTFITGESCHERAHRFQLKVKRDIGQTATPITTSTYDRSRSRWLPESALFSPARLNDNIGFYLWATMYL